MISDSTVVISEHVIFHGITDWQENKLLIIQDKNGLLIIEREGPATSCVVGNIAKPPLARRIALLTMRRPNARENLSASFLSSV